MAASKAAPSASRMRKPPRLNDRRQRKRTVRIAPTRPAGVRGVDHGIGLPPPQASSRLAGFGLGRFELFPQRLVEGELEIGKGVAFADEGHVEHLAVRQADEGEQPSVRVPLFGPGKELHLGLIEPGEGEPLGQEGHEPDALPGVVELLAVDADEADPFVAPAGQADLDVSPS